MTFRLGLTGSIGMGKSTTAAMFADEGCPVWDADAAVHRLYSQGGPAVALMERAFPDVVREGVVCREALKQIIRRDPGALHKIEAIVHPLVAQDRQVFIDAQTAPITVLDIPLLFETGAERYLDSTVVVSTTPEEQQARVMARGTMDAGQLKAIIQKQLPDAEKRTRADYVIETDSLDHARSQVRDVLGHIKRTRLHA
ncbi:dephospho-CoA kinase [Roseovarius tolerans]|uniref:Dephospho-CoA kinase n=1 Tax=Roseovarius tolerans TaxID=74031 RepID=A0A1H8GPQ4_9RHOB|nr:dephospho-CoA kinase [Roseovarius tolerans]SEN45956.1 dephospho-CoA kinase [Roseovarius tolerans]